MRVSPSARTAVTTSTRKTRRRGPAISACLSDPPGLLVGICSALSLETSHSAFEIRNTSPSNFPFQPLCLRFCWFLISRLSLSRCVLRSARAFSLSVEWRDLIPFRDFTHHWHARNKTCNLRPASPPRFGTPNPAASPTRLHTKYTGQNSYCLPRIPRVPFPGEWRLAASGCAG